jgi:integrase
MTKRWRYRAGDWGRNRIRVFERGPSGLLYVEFYERDGDRLVKRKVSLGHRDRARAKRQADQMAERAGSMDLPALDVTLEQLFDIYVREVSGTKTASTARHDRACVAMFLRIFGAKRNACNLDIRDWQRFIERRRTGQISPNGHGRPVGDRQVEYDLKTLRAMLNWATKARSNGRTLLERNPVAGFPLPKEESPCRPVFTEAQYEAILAVADTVDRRFTLALVLAHETGHRISAIARLRWTDIDLESGTILWRKKNDKQGYEHQVPVSSLALEALKIARQVDPSLGNTWVLPSPRNSAKPCCRETLTKWLRTACTRAGGPRKRGQGFHSLRRKFATDLREAPLKVVAELGGWKSTRTLLDCYQLPDHQALRRALAIRPRIRPTQANGTRLIRPSGGATA